MTIEKFFKFDIDFDALESVAYRWGLQDKSIQKIQFYAGVDNKPVLLFSFSEPTIESLWGHCMNGLRHWQNGWVELREACLRDNTQYMRSWLIFAHDESENQYMTSEYCWRKGKNTVCFEKDPEDMFDDASNLLPGGIRLTKDDFVGDSWILTESGFKKHVLDVKPKTLFENKKILDVPQIDSTEIISSVLNKSWEPDRPINRLSQNRELTIWNSWIQPIIDHHYNGVFGYIYFKEPESIDRDDLGALWEQHIAPFICSNLPQWIKYPQSFPQAELESRISENIWEPNLFISEVFIPLKAGRGSAFVDPFLQCLANIIDKGDLPAFLTYLEQERGGAVYTMEQPETIHKASPEASVPEKNQWMFTLNGPVWDVMFDGKTGHVEDCTPVRRMMLALERPDVKFPYIQLSQIAGGTAADPESVSCQKNVPFEDGLSNQDNGGERPTKHDIDNMEAALHLQYKRYLQDQETERDKWLNLKRIAETSYKLIATETDKGLTVRKSKWATEDDPKLKKARQAISKNRTVFLRRIQHLQELYDHMTRFLKMDNGIIYSPPKGSPNWQIQQDRLKK